MTVMTATVQPSLAPGSGPFTRADLHNTPDDGRRYELIDGVLLVSSAPSLQHQVALGNLYVDLRVLCPSGLRVILAPFAVALAADTELQPDLLIAPVEQFTSKELPGGPLLAVEVLSPSTSRIDRLLKRDRLQEAGVPSYWLVDPLLPAVTVLELRAGGYVEVARVVGDERLVLEQPFPVTLTPLQLLR